MSIPAWCHEIVRMVSDELDGPGGSTSRCAAMAYAIFRNASWCVACDGEGVDDSPGTCLACNGSGRVIPDSCVSEKDIFISRKMLNEHNRR